MKLRRPFLLASFAVLALLFCRPAGALTPYRVADIDPTFRGSSSAPGPFYRIGTRALFVARTPEVGLWATDGTVAGTRRLVAAALGPIGFIASTGELLFFQTCDSQGCRLRVTDGTPAGTRQVASGGTFGAGVAAGPRRIYFVRQTAATGIEPWTSDGTPAGTRIVKDLIPGRGSSGPQRLTWSSGRLWFFSRGGLWTSDGTPAGTRRIATLGNGEVRVVGALGARLLYFFAAQVSGQRLWASDGTAAGTKPLGVSTSPNQQIDPFVIAGATAYFTLQKDDGQGFVREIWATDGTPARTRKVASFGFNDFTPPLVPVGNRIAFVAGDSDQGLELWQSDGTATGTRGIDVCPGSCSGLSSIGAVDGERIWFAGETPAAGRELWTSDLTAAGTRLVKDLEPGSRSSEPEQFLAGGGKVFFSARPPFAPEGFWFSDGTAGGTQLLKQSPNADSRLGLLLGAIVGGRAFLALNDEIHGSEPWVSDGTPAGTRLVTDLDPNQEGGSFPRALRSAGGRCYFLTHFDESAGSPELWSSDGTATGTFLARRLDDSQVSMFVRSADLGSRIALVAHLARISHRSSLRGLLSGAGPLNALTIVGEWAQDDQGA